MLKVQVAPYSQYTQYKPAVIVTDEEGTMYFIFCELHKITACLAIPTGDGFGIPGPTSTHTPSPAKAQLITRRLLKEYPGVFA